LIGHEQVKRARALLLPAVPPWRSPAAAARQHRRLDRALGAPALW
jgi:hypothetical protein